MVDFDGEPATIASSDPAQGPVLQGFLPGLPVGKKRLARSLRSRRSQVRPLPGALHRDRPHRGRRGRRFDGEFDGAARQARLGPTRRTLAQQGISVAGATGLEPATSGVTGRRSNQLSYAPGDGEIK